MNIAKQCTKIVAIGGIIVANIGAPTQALAQPPSIVFTSNRDGDTEIYSANRNGDNMKRLTYNTTAEGGVAASPGGDKVAYVTSDETTLDSTISLLDIKTGSSTTILHTPHVQYQAPVWSPDGKYIAYSLTTTVQSEYMSCIAIYKVANGDTNKISCSDKALVEPAWSPDSQKLMFTQFVVATGGDLYTVNVFKNEEKHYLRSGFFGAYSPSGDKIAFTAHDSNFVNQIYIADSNGANPQQITVGDDLHTVADWASDGYITFTNVTPGTWQFQVKSVRSDGSGMLTIPQKTGVADWSGKGLLP